MCIGSQCWRCDGIPFWWILSRYNPQVVCNFIYSVSCFQTHKYHRVVQPPPDQRQYTRLGIFYFCTADDDVRLAPLATSPLLQRVGFRRWFEKDEDAPLMVEWRKARTSAYGQTTLAKSTDEDRVEEEVINGVVVKHYN